MGGPRFSGTVAAALRLALLAGATGFALSACGHEPPPQQQSPRLLLTAAPGEPTGEALRAAVAARAGVAVLVWAPVDARTAGVRFDCLGPVCDQAIARLRADTALVAALVADERQRVPAPPERGTAR